MQADVESIARNGPMMRTIVFAIAFLCCMGCSGKTMPSETYAKESLAVAEDFLKNAHRIADAPFPSKDGLSREDRLKYLSERVINDAKSFEPLIQRANSLKPPEQFKPYHQALVNLITGEAKLMSEWGEAIGTQDRQLMEAAQSRLETHEADALAQLVSALAQLASTDPSARQHLDQLIAKIAANPL